MHPWRPGVLSPTKSPDRLKLERLCSSRTSKAGDAGGDRNLHFRHLQIPAVSQSRSGRACGLVRHLQGEGANRSGWLAHCRYCRGHLSGGCRLRSSLSRQECCIGYSRRVSAKTPNCDPRPWRSGNGFHLRTACRKRAATGSAF